MAKVYLLCGKIASGKTTYAQGMQSQTGAVILSYDELMLQLYDGCLGEVQHEQAVARICRYFYQLSEQLLSVGVDVLLDFGYWRYEERESARAFYRARGLVAVLVYFDLDEETRLNRLTKRNLALSGAKERVYLIEGELLEKLDRKFEPPKAMEIDIRITYKRGEE